MQTDDTKKLTWVGRQIIGLAKLTNRITPLSKGNTTKREVRAMYGERRYAFSWSYDGEKNLGEFGPPRDYYPNYDMLRIRSWQLFLESEIAQTVFNKYVTWIIGRGLRLQCEPSNAVLESENIPATTEDFTKIVESRFMMYARSSMCDYGGMKSLHKIAAEAYKNADIGGDVLVILHYIDDCVKVQLIDGAHLKSPGYNGVVSTDNGNKIYYGIEIDGKGNHVAYHLQVKTKKYRIPAMNNGIRVAFLVYGLKYRLDNHRGMPLISSVMETVKKLERYKEATVASAEERQKVAIQAVHQPASTGESPWDGVLAKVVDTTGDEDVPTDINDIQLADTVAATVNKQLINNPIGVELKQLESKNELYFKDFYEVNRDAFCAAISIPPNVAMSQYNDSFSASRAATKDWEHTIDVKREDFSFEFYQRVYTFWFYMEVLNNKIDAPGFVNAIQTGNTMVCEAYLCGRWTGARFPHIDPLKEVKAEREKLGPAGAHLPLTTLEAATENVSGGDSGANIQQFAKELEKAEELEIPINAAAPITTEGGDGEGGDDPEKD